VPRIFKFIQNKGNIDDKEMYHTLNMGIGLVLIVDAQATEKIISTLAEFKVRSWVIGKAESGRKEVKIS
jgi:phosphoribosylformylglycinamidine cyclo-ligase